MAAKKTPYVDSAWENNPMYPEKRGICEVCKQKDDVKLAFDHVRYICINASACLLRWRKSREK